MTDIFDMSVRANVKEITRTLSRLAHTQINFATAQALTALAKEVQVDETRNIGSTFNKPKPFTQKSVGVQGARKDTLQAKVFVRPIAARYLEPYEKGGSHVLSGRALINPKNIKLDSYGQLPRKALARLKARKDIFIGPVKTKSGIVNGVWQRTAAKATITNKKTGTTRISSRGVNTSGALKLLIRFGDALAVRTHLGYHARATAMVNANFNAEMDKAMIKAIGTARP